MPINHIPIEENKNKPEKNDMDYVIVAPKYSFDDIVLPQQIVDDLKSVIALSKHQDLIFEEWGLGNVIKRNQNITINLYGDSGTGKTMTAHALARALDKQMLFVKYSEIESKYVGETSKNLVKLFDVAQEKGVIIVFDEADALLSKRVTMMSSATDVSVNQTRNVLLQLLDEYKGTIIFTTNFIENFDFAFMRRILYHIKFEKPNEEARKRLWQFYLVEKLPIMGNKSELIDNICKVEDLTGADIANIVLKAAIIAAGNNVSYISRENIEEEISKVKKSKEDMQYGNFTVTSRKVTKEYVENKLNNGGLCDGIN